MNGIGSVGYGGFDILVPAGDHNYIVEIFSIM
jgi:hypothetical protein